MASDSKGGRVSLWVDGERLTADRAAFWAAVDRVEDPLDDLDAFRAALRDISDTAE